MKYPTIKNFLLSEAAKAVGSTVIADYTISLSLNLS